ncbi:hypothetical protein [Caballeronia sp. LZ003]|uniref:hypothetical protein n=1 Tax=Caballeronia sp. LZ003 TaxID=3038559 RepID=UPI00285716AA|nr:hypothetical protein [Caballeronia sp. LZ003]MDR5852792.1 hypothetical protein [Caballeronia sp. LZ003]
MSAYTYIEMSSVPRPLLQMAVRQVEGLQSWISFPGCPFAGIEEEGEVQFPYPSNRELREQLVAWLDHWNISYGIEQ